ncbi:uncharacterized protein [Rutidosis leptorrhynchoides]|uniref:uncharacterized protein n=1 Tax=Rutidosis leptorrhynchoides TaxID=125765 RepID=UPI003A98D1E1
MQPQSKHSWINLAELKDRLTKKLGPERSSQYFDYLKSFLSLKLNKPDFDKLCLRTLGRDNISLHNQLIRSILNNACTRTVPPTIVDNKVYLENGSIPVVHRKSGKEVASRNSLHPPLGIQKWPVSGSRKVSSLGSSSKCVTDGLLETLTLKERMDNLAATQGLQGVSMDCARVLNNSLDFYLKNLIRSVAKLSGPGLGHEPIKNGSVNHQAHLRPLNGVTPVCQYQIQSRMQEREPKRAFSLRELTVAMELDPQQLGEDWPVLLEMIYTHGFEE